jgi:hypothetical protein
VHWSLDERLRAAVVEFPLNPVKVLLFVKPGRWKSCATKRAATPLKKVDHRKGVVALR